MKMIKQWWAWEYLLSYEYATKHIERAGRTAYKSEDKITEGSAETFIKNLIKRGHESVLEHLSVSVRIITNRRVSHELVRHRIASYTQESQRYVAYKDEVTFILPVWFYDCEKNINGYILWLNAINDAEYSYLELLKTQTPQEAADVLPNATKTEISMTANLREWRTIFKLRCSKKAHPQMRELMCSMLDSFIKEYPIFFEDLFYLLED